MGLLTIRPVLVCSMALSIVAGTAAHTFSQAAAAPGGNAPAGIASEYQVKAAFLYNFGKFVDWPADSFSSPSAAFTLCVVGADPFGEILDRTVQGKVINGHPVSALRLTRHDDLRVCHIVYISPSERKAIEEILDQLRGVSVLTVGETEGLTERGGMVNFVVEDNRVRFEANPLAAERSRLRISSKLLALARVVQTGEHR
jgi:hypothetical protein